MVIFCCIHVRGDSQWVPNLLFCILSVNIIYLSKLVLHFPRANCDHSWQACHSSKAEWTPARYKHYIHYIDLTLALRPLKQLAIRCLVWKLNQTSNEETQKFCITGPFHEHIFHRNSNSLENWFWWISILGYHITTKFCTCHDNTAVMPCSTFHSNCFIITWMRAKLNLR